MIFFIYQIVKEKQDIQAGSASSLDKKPSRLYPDGLLSLFDDIRRRFLLLNAKMLAKSIIILFHRHMNIKQARTIGQ